MDFPVLIANQPATARRKTVRTNISGLLMTKNQLLDLLNAIPGDPEIVVWNGYVGDWMSLEDTLTESALVRETPEFVKSSLIAEAWSHDHLPASSVTDEDVESAMEYRHWELPNPHVKPADLEKWYGTERQPIVILNPKPRGITTFDRIGDISY